MGRRSNRLVVGVMVAALAASSPGSAAAEILKNFRLGGQIDVQASSAHNTTDFARYANPAPGAAANNDRIGDAQTRVMIHLDWDLLDDVHSRVTFRKNDRTYGHIGGAPANQPAGTVSQPLQANAAGNVLGNIFIDEAHFKIDKIAGQFDMTLGRQFYGDSGDIVLYFGPSEKAWYGLPTSALDAGRIDWNFESIAMTGVVGKTVGGPLGVAVAAHSDLRGLNVAFKGNEHFRGGVYGWNLLTHNIGAVGAPPTSGGAAGGKNDSLWVLGIKAKLAGAGFWLKGEYAQNLGENRVAGTATAAPAASYIGWAVLANAGYKAESEDIGMLSLWGEMAVGSGRQRSRESHNDGFTPIAPDYRPGSYYGRFAANTGFAGLGLGMAVPVGTAVVTANNSLNNREIWGAGVRMSPAVANKMTLAVSWWDFRVHRFTRLPNATTDPFLGNKHLGAELDVDLIWTHSENVALAAGWATFQPGGLVREGERQAVAGGVVGGRGVQPATLTYFDVRVRF